MSRDKALRGLVQAMGYACLAIGLFHVLLGNAAIPGGGSAGPTIDSLGRFFGAVFAGYGLGWLWAARQSPIPATAVRWLAGVFLLGAVGRVLSLTVHGWPHWFQVALAVVELVLAPPVKTVVRTLKVTAPAARPGFLPHSSQATRALPVSFIAVRESRSQEGSLSSGRVQNRAPAPGTAEMT
ncbi:DUF4345 domain-containing protein, partial [Streptomyces sp. sk2.1]